VDDSASERDVAACKRQSQQKPVEMTRMDFDIGGERIGDALHVQQRRPEADEREVTKVH
jgi:hypothetical protein